MTNHDFGHPTSQEICNRLLDAMRQQLPHIQRKEAGGTCTMFERGQFNFAHLYHRKTTPEVKIYFHTDPNKVVANLPREFHLQTRPKIKNGWEKRFPYFFTVPALDAVDTVAEFLLTEALPFSTAHRRRRAEELEQVRSQQEAGGAFAPADLEDARKRILVAIVLRQGQRAFRDQLLASYRQACAVTGCDVVEALEAAHIVAYRGPETNHVTNGLLLRADIHTLFDLRLLAVHPTDYRLIVSRWLRGTAYEALDGQMIRLPTNHAEHPSREVLELHMVAFQAKESESDPA